MTYNQPAKGKFKIISTHTLRKEGDIESEVDTSIPMPFQPTPSARRVTFGFHNGAARRAISTHTLRKEGDGDILGIAQTFSISTHTLRKEGDHALPRAHH